MATNSCLVINIFILCSTEERNQIGLDQLEGEHFMAEVSVLGELSL